MDCTSSSVDQSSLLPFAITIILSILNDPAKWSQTYHRKKMQDGVTQVSIVVLRFKCPWGAKPLPKDDGKLATQDDNAPEVICTTHLWDCLYTFHIQTRNKAVGVVARVLVKQHQNLCQMSKLHFRALMMALTSAWWPNWPMKAFGDVCTKWEGTASSMQQEDNRRRGEEAGKQQKKALQTLTEEGAHTLTDFVFEATI